MYKNKDEFIDIIKKSRIKNEKESKKNILSLRKKMNKFTEMEIKIIKKNSKKILKTLNRELKKNWFKDCRWMLVINQPSEISTLIIYNVTANKIFSSVAFLHEVDVGKFSDYLSKRITFSKISSNVEFILSVSDEISNSKLTTANLNSVIFNNGCALGNLN